MRLFLRLFFCVLTPLAALAHGDLHIRIEEVTSQVNAQPNNALLYLKRGKLYLDHIQYDKALNDFKKAEQLDPKLSDAKYEIANWYYLNADYKKAEAAIDNYLKEVDKSADGHLLKARILVEQKKEASASFTRAIQLSTQPEPELYVERAESLRKAKKLDEAAEGLREGLKRLGNIISLREPLIDLEVKRKNYPEALKQIDEVVATTDRKEKWFLLKGDVYEASGDKKKARESYQQAKAAFELLPERIKAAKPSIELSKKIELKARDLNGVQR